MADRADRSIAGLLAAAALCAALGATLWRSPVPVLLWNASASSPIGLYAVNGQAPLDAGDMAVAWPPAGARRLAAARHYLPAHIPLVKHVAAVAGALVCADGGIVTVNRRGAVMRRRYDRAGRRLPWWSGCIRLRPGELFLLSEDVPDAFDGRYFGITRRPEVIGNARLLWRR